MLVLSNSTNISNREGISDSNNGSNNTSGNNGSNQCHECTAVLPAAVHTNVTRNKIQAGTGNRVIAMGRCSSIRQQILTLNCLLTHALRKYLEHRLELKAKHTNAAAG